MKREELLTVLEEISDKHILEAERPPMRKVKKLFMGAVAAMLVLAVGISMMSGPIRIAADAVATASEPRIMERPDSDDYKNLDDWRADRDIWEAERNLRDCTAAEAVQCLHPFFTEGNQEFLTTEAGENKLWSPINAYIGLAMTTELTKGASRQQVLDLFGVPDSDTLRKQVSAVWENVYRDNANEICVAANSLWLEKGLGYEQEAMDAIGYHYYGSVYQTDLGSNRANKDIAAWVNNHTGRFLRNSADEIALSRDTIMALYSTLYFQSKWQNEFAEGQNTRGAFHAPGGDVEAEYMNKKLSQMNYYWGENFGAVSLPLKNGSSMWFILPDEGKTTNDVLEDGTYMDMFLPGQWEDFKYMKVNLSVPKFDVTAAMDLREGLENMGVTDVFAEGTADFSGLTGDSPIYLTGANQAVRVEIDEEGVKAAVYIEIPGAGSAEPPKDIIDFVLDRPFLFVITSDNIPLFAGCINQP